MRTCRRAEAFSTSMRQQQDTKQKVAMHAASYIAALAGVALIKWLRPHAQAQSCCLQIIVHVSRITLLTLYRYSTQLRFERDICFGRGFILSDGAFQTDLN